MIGFPKPKPRPSVLDARDKRRAEDAEYWANRKIALERDNHTCRVPRCGRTAFQTHHLIPRSLRRAFHAFSNLLSVCDTCHELLQHHVIKAYAADGSGELNANKKLRFERWSDKTDQYERMVA